MFLETLVLSKFSQEKTTLASIANELSVNYSVSVSKQAVDNRFNDFSVEFVKLCIEELLANNYFSKSNTEIFSLFKRVRVKDSTAFMLPENLSEQYPGNGGKSSNASARIQYEFDLKNADIIDFDIQGAASVNDYSDAMNKKDNVKTGDLIIRDLGYSSLEALKSIKSNGAYFISRLKSDIGIYTSENKDIEQITPDNLLARLQKSKKTYIELNAFIVRRKYFPIRMIVYKVPEEKVKERIKKRRAHCKRSCRPFKKSYLKQAQMNVYITNIDGGLLNPEQIFNTYRLRWQIELVFKAWKSIGEINVLKDVKKERVITLLYAKLLWMLLNWEIIKEVSNSLFNISPTGNRKMLSNYKSYHAIKRAIDTIRMVLHKKKKLKETMKNLIKTLLKTCILEHRKGKPIYYDLLL